MRTHLLTPFGIEIEGFSIQQVTEKQAGDIKLLIARNRVAVLRKQITNDADLVVFLRLLGDLMFTKGEPPVPEAPDLNVVSNVGRDTPPRSVFHTDTSYVAKPPSFTALQGIKVPVSGGETLFTDQVAAADDLPDGLRIMLEGRTLRHGVTGLKGQNTHYRHPVLRRHPDTGEVSLFLSTPERCTGLDDTDEYKSAELVSMLFEHSTQSQPLYRHRWRPHDIVIWDNRITLHRADHTNVAGDRVLHRGLVRGERPIPE